MQPILAAARIKLMRFLLFLAATLTISAALLYNFAALATFNAFILKDGQTRVVAGDVPYGEDARQQLDIYGPDKIAAPLPLLLFVHGGSWREGDRSGYAFIGRTFAARGYLTLVMNYRLVPNHPFPDFVRDVALAIAWAEKNGAGYGGDPSRIFVVGHSAGAYNAAMAVLDTSYLDAAGVDASALRGVATLAGPFDFLPLDSKSTIEAFGNAPDLNATQPINFARADAPPFLLLAGTGDTTVYPRNSRSLARKLREKGGVVELREYADVSHIGILLALAKPFRRSSVPVLEDIMQFFAKHRG